MHTLVTVLVGILFLILIVIVAGVLRSKHVAKVRAEEARKTLEARKAAEASYDPYRARKGGARSTGGYSRTKRDDSSDATSTLFAAGIFGTSSDDSSRHHGSSHHSSGYDSGSHHSGGYDSGSHHSSGYDSGSHHSGGYDSGSHHSSGYDSGSHHSGGYDSGSSSSYDSGGSFDSSSF